MNTKLIIIISFTYLYGFFDIFMSFRKRQERKIIASNDKGSLWIPGILIAIGYTLSFSIGATTHGRLYPWNTYFGIGAFVVLIGLIIRIAAILSLKKHFTYTVTKIENHKLIESGLYKRIRHPGYLGQLIIFFGITISMANWMSVIAMLIPVFAGFIYPIEVEEKFMKAQMGQKYIDYVKKTKRLIPYVF